MNSVYTILLAVISLITVLGILWIGPILQYVFADTPFSQVDGKMSLAVTLARLLFLYLFLITLYAYFMGIANALGYFFIPALAPAFLNLSIIIFACLPSEVVSIPSLLLCWGVLIGGFVQVLLTGILLFRLQFLPKCCFYFSTQDLKVMAGRFFPGLLGVGGLAIIGLLNLYFSGLLKEGTHTFIYYGDRLLELPRSLIAVSLGTALLPSLSQLVAQGDKHSMLEKAAHQRDILLFLVIPCAIVLFCLNQPIIEILFQRGLFDSFTTQQTSTVVQIYSVLLISTSLCHVLSTSFYSVQNTWYPALSVVLYVVFHWLFTPYLMKNFDLKGLVWGTVLSNIFFMFLLGSAYPTYVGQLYLGRTLKRLLGILTLLIPFSFYLNWFFPFLVRVFNTVFQEIVSQCASLFIVLLSSFTIYICIALNLRLPAAIDFVNSLKKKVGS